MKQPRRPWRGVIHVGLCGGVFRGEAGDNALHAHGAHQVSVGLDGPVTVRAGARSVRSRAVFVAATCAHRIERGTVLSIYADVSSDLGVGMRAAAGCRAAVVALSEQIGDRLAMVGSTARELTTDVVAEIAGVFGHRSTYEQPDPALLRITRVLSAAIRHGDTPSRAALATLAGLSEGRFSHWFRERAGMPMHPYWPWALLVSAIGIAAVALLERLQPYEPKWLEDHGDTFVDVLHGSVSLGLIFATVEIATIMRTWLPIAPWWPSWPAWASVLAAGAVIDLGLWAMHRASHGSGILWRLHALHHSAQRLYWLNGERRHPLSAIVLATPGITAAILLGAPPQAIGTWMAMVSVHLAFQHANLDFTLGPLRYLLCVAEIHRWHHKREYEDAQVNFGEIWTLWDHLAGTFHDQRNGVRAGEVGLRDEVMPSGYVAQLAWPFTR